MVLASDYRSVSLSLLDSEGMLSRDDCINSGTRAPALSQALSGDVALPSNPQAGHEVLLIDRGNAALTWVDPRTCQPLRQLAVGTGFAANPHDVVSLGANKAYVTRYERNNAPTPALEDFDEGNDLLIIDPSVPKILGRIDLLGTSPDPSVLPRADQALLAEGRVYVSLNALSPSFQSGSMGRVVIIDPGSDTVVGYVDIPGKKNCSTMTYLASTKTLWVSCAGVFSDGAQQANYSGLVAIDLGASPPAIKGVVDASAFGGRILLGKSAIFSEQEIFAITAGDFSGSPPDQFWTLGLSSSQATRLFEASESFVLGASLADLQRKRIFLTDGTASAPRIHIYDASTPGTVREVSSFNPGPSLGLPARDISRY
ncbi:YncE family protein [Corallococcus llansteffanensis]|uniref:Uncharacterized protein n=1 Tax=Corallococcus llansteffanensis TaxID=2316731 RepID=A0A3A8PT14_9BACT|nr:hypothetical protein [Corallococcus llansteffanensis]RKH54624.1 hypothetical protein D7V93_25235 [Corallococcus llansteffanensis]